MIDMSHDSHGSRLAALSHERRAVAVGATRRLDRTRHDPTSHDWTDDGRAWHGHGSARGAARTRGLQHPAQEHEQLDRLARLQHFSFFLQGILVREVRRVQRAHTIHRRSIQAWAASPLAARAAPSAAPRSAELGCPLTSR